MTVEATPVPRGLGGVRYALRLSPDRWQVVDRSSPDRGLATVVGAWLLLAFARLGLPALTAPRVLVRFVLVGVYVWLLMAIAVWLVGRLAGRLGRGGETPDPVTSLQFTGLAHQPLLIIGVVLQLGQVIPGQRPFTVAVIVAVGLWLPGVLVAAMVSAFGRLDRWSLGVGLAIYAGWTLLAGRYLLDRVGHLF